MTLTNGTSFDVSLGNAVTIQDLINVFQQASVGRVQVAINPADPFGLIVTQVAPSSSGQTSVFSIVAVNGSLAAEDLGIQHLQVSPANQSYAAGDLGIQGVDVGSTGSIYGLALHGDSLQKHFFIENATFQGSLVGTATQVNATADFGAVPLKMTNGSGAIQAQGSLTIKNLTTLQQLTSALTGTSTLSSLVSSQISGSGQITLPLALNLSVPLTGYSLPAGAKVVVNMTDFTNPSTLSVTVTPALNLSGLTIQPVLQGLENVASFVQSAGSSLLSQPLPGLGTSLENVFNPASILNSAVNTLTLNPPQTIDQLVSQLSTLLGETVTVSFVNNMLQVNLNYGFSTTQAVNLGFTLSPTLGSIADVNGADPLSLTVKGSVSMGLVIDLTQPSSPQYDIQDSSKLSVSALVNALGVVAFNATVGPLGVSISGGSVQLTDGIKGQAATWTAGLNTSSANHLWPLSSAVNDVNTAINGQVDIVLPTFFATTNVPVDPNTKFIELKVTNLANASSTTTLTVPNLTAAMNSVSLNDIMNQAVEGWDGLMRKLQSALTQEIDVENIPVVGTQLQQALSFLQTMDQTVTTQLENAPQLAATTVQDALYAALGPQGLNWLVNLVPGGASTEDNFVQLVQSNGSIHYLLQLHENLTAVSVPVAVNLGLSGLGLAVDGNLNFNAGFDATLGFGLSQQYGFYVDSTDTASVGFNADLPSSAIATLGFLQFNLSNNSPQTPQLSGALSLGLNNVNGTGRLSLNDLSSASAYTLGMAANANLNLHLDATIAGNTNLPHVSTDFYFTWSTNPTTSNPDTLGFNNVTLDLGGFIDSIFGEIQQVLKPIEPLAQVLTAPLPVLSQLAGHNVDLVDLASAPRVRQPRDGGFPDRGRGFRCRYEQPSRSAELGSWKFHARSDRGPEPFLPRQP